MFPGSTKISSPDESTGNHHTHHESTAPTRSEYLRPSTQLLKFPIEVLCLIINELDLNSLYRLSHYSRKLRSILNPEIHVRFRRIFAPWANTPLICAGDYMESNPPGIETCVPQGFTLNLPGAENENQNYSNYSVYQFMDLLNPTNVTQEESFCPPTLKPILARQNTPWYSRPRCRPWQRILKLQQYFPAGRHWVLKNLTQKEYVYVHQLTSNDGHGGGIDRPDGEHLWGFNLGTVVAVNTCWSDDSSASMSGLDIQGCWAGNCFDIVVEEKLREDMKAYNGWKNVSLREWRKMVDLFIVNDWNI